MIFFLSGCLTTKKNGTSLQMVRTIGITTNGIIKKS